MFTGIKDQQGKDIYEGDILKVFRSSGYKGGGKFIGIVVYNDYDSFARFEMRGNQSRFSYEADCIDRCCKIIGNLYENPELKEEITANKKDDKHS